jgi:hypothetical protein
MTNNKKTNKQKKTQKQSIFMQGPHSNALTYSGPINSMSNKEALDVHCFLVNITNVIASSAGGVINTVITPSSQVTSSGNWASLAALFSEYRVLGYKWEAYPINPYQVGATQFPIFSVIDRSSATALGSLSSAADYSSAKQHILNAKWSRTARMSDAGEAGWINIGGTPSSTNEMYLKLYASGLAASTNYFQYIGYYLVQFRGIK